MSKNVGGGVKRAGQVVGNNPSPRSKPCTKTSCGCNKKPVANEAKAPA